MSTWGGFKRFGEEKLSDKKCFYSSVKDGTTADNYENLDGHINDEGYLTCKKIWNEFHMKNMSDHQDHHFKKCVLLLVDVVELLTDTYLILVIIFVSLIKLGCYVKDDWYEVKKNCGH